jgi:pimeloyl-ACP methyl ester carboxylesterase
MKPWHKTILVLLILAIAWQFIRPHFFQEEKMARKELRKQVEYHFPELALVSGARYGITKTSREFPNRPHVLLIHGLDDPGKVWSKLIPELKERQFNTWVMLYPNDQPITESAEFLKNQLRVLKTKGLNELSIVAHSMGGLVSREMLTNPKLQCTEPSCKDDVVDVEQLIMVGTPNHGSELARMRFFGEIREQLERLINGENIWLEWIFDGAGEAGIDLIPDSEFLTSLNARPHPVSTRYLVIAGIIGKNESDRLSQIYQQYFSDEKLLSTINTVMETLGDGLVTVESATLKGVPIETVNGNHLTIIRNIISDDERMPPAIPLIIEHLE